MKRDRAAALVLVGASLGWTLNAISEAESAIADAQQAWHRITGRATLNPPNCTTTHAPHNTATTPRTSRRTTHGTDREAAHSGARGRARDAGHDA